MKLEKTLLINASMLAAIWYLTMPQPAHAYFDLATGTYLYQLIFGVGAALWFSFMSKFNFRKPKIKNSSTAAASTSPADATPSATDMTVDADPGQSAVSRTSVS